jgi:hypothetical protein
VNPGRSRISARAAQRCVTGVLLVGALLSCNSCQTRSTAASETAKAGPRASISFCATSAQNCAPAASFTASNTKELTIRAWTLGVPPGNHTQILAISMPDSAEYPETRTGFRVPDGSKDPFQELRTISMAELQSSPNKIAGIWTVRLLLDGKLLATEKFEMKPQGPSKN